MGTNERVAGAPRLSDRVTIRELKAEELDEAERIVRLAFGTFLQITDPLANPTESQGIAHRFRNNSRNVLAAELDGKLAGTNVMTRWGSFAYFGPLTVRPELWDSGIASKLLEATVRIFNQWGVLSSGLFTFADSPKHLGLYHKFGFYPRFLNAVMSKEVKASAPRSNIAPFTTFSSLDASEKANFLRDCRKLTFVLFQGLDLTSEITLVDDQKLGDTVILREGTSLSAFAVCQSGAKTEAGKEKCSVKFGAAKIGAGAEKRFEILLLALQAFAADRAAAKLETGVNLSHASVYDQLLKNGFRTLFQGVEMQRPNMPSIDREDTFVLDDLR